MYVCMYEQSLSTKTHVCTIRCLYQYLYEYLYTLGMKAGNKANFVHPRRMLPIPGFHQLFQWDQQATP